MAEKFYLNATMDYKGDSYFPIMDKVFFVGDYLYIGECFIDIYNYDDNNLLFVTKSKVYIIDKKVLEIKKEIDLPRSSYNNRYPTYFDSSENVIYYISTDYKVCKYDFTNDENTELTEANTDYKAPINIDKTGDFIFIITSSNVFKISLIDFSINSASRSFSFMSKYNCSENYIYDVYYSSSDKIVTAFVINKEDLSMTSFTCSSGTSYTIKGIIGVTDKEIIVDLNDKIGVINIEKQILNSATYKYTEIYSEKSSQKMIGYINGTIKEVTNLLDSCDKKLAILDDSLNNILSIVYIDTSFYVLTNYGICTVETRYEKSNTFAKLEVI